MASGWSHCLLFESATFNAISYGNLHLNPPRLAAPSYISAWLISSYWSQEIFPCTPHIITCPPSYSNLYHDTSMATVLTPTLYGLITLQVPNHVSFLHFLFSTKWSVQCQTHIYVYIKHLWQFISWGNVSTSLITQARGQTPYRLSANTYWHYLQLLFILKAFPQCASSEGAMPLWQGPTDRGVNCTCNLII